MKKTVLALMAAVFVLTVGIGTADAAWVTGFSTAKKILQNASSTTLQTQSAATQIIYRLGTGETLNTNDTLVLTLSGGAKFSATAPTLTGSGAGYTIVGSPTGLTTANFRVAEVQNVGTDVLLNTNGTIFDVSAVTGNVDVTLSATTSVGSLPIFNKAQSTLTGAKYAFSAPEASVFVGLAASTNVADVSAAAGAFKKFLGNATAGTAATLNIANKAEGVAAAGTSPAWVNISAGKILAGISGSLTGITSVSGTGCTGSSSTGSTTGGTANFFLINTAKTNAYCVNTALLLPHDNGGAILSLAPIFTIDGTTAQAARGFNATVDILVDGTTWAAHNALAATALYSITRNGSSFVTNSVGPRNTIKITDRSGGVATAGGAITITAYDAAGVAIPEASGQTALTLLNNATTTITGTALAARFPTGTPMRYDFAVESSSIVVTNVKASVDGTFSATTIFTTGAATATGIANAI